MVTIRVFKDDVCNCGLLASSGRVNGRGMAYEAVVPSQDDYVAVNYSPKGYLDEGEKYRGQTNCVNVQLEGSVNAASSNNILDPLPSNSKSIWDESSPSTGVRVLPGEKYYSSEVVYYEMELPAICRVSLMPSQIGGYDFTYATMVYSNDRPYKLPIYITYRIYAWHFGEDGKTVTQSVSTYYLDPKSYYAAETYQNAVMLLDSYVTRELPEILNKVHTLPLKRSATRTYNCAMGDAEAIISVLKKCSLQSAASQLNKLYYSFNWNQAAYDAYSEIGWESNGIAYFSDLTRMYQSIMSTKNTIFGLLRSGKAKLAANLFLSVHYGWKLFIKDTWDFSQFLQQRAQLSRCASIDNSTVEGITFRYQCYYYPYRQILDDMQMLLTKLMDLDLDFNNAWDMVPFSFVADWFTNIGDTLQAIDTYGDLKRVHEVAYTIQSVTGRIPVGESISKLLPNAELYYKLYKRSIGKEPVLPSLLVTVDPKPSITHAIEAGALVIGK